MTFRMNHLIRVSALIVPVLASACYSLDDYGASDRVGAIGFNLTLPGDMQSEDLNYTIVGPGAYHKVGKFPFGPKSHSFSATITDIPAGTGYQLQLASDSDPNKTRCTGSAAFDIMPKATTSVGVGLQCHRVKVQGPPPPPLDAGVGHEEDASVGHEQDSGTGGIDVGGDVNLCPEIDGLYVWKEANGTFEFSSSACDPDSMPARLRYKWSVSAGKLLATDDEVVKFVCPDAGGSVQVTLEVSDSACSDMHVREINCDCAKDQTPEDHHHGKDE